MSPLIYYGLIYCCDSRHWIFLKTYCCYPWKVREHVWIQWASMDGKNEPLCLRKKWRACTTRIGENAWIEWATKLEKNEWAYTARIGEYVRTEWATMVAKNEWACTTINVRTKWTTMLEKNEWLEWTSIYE
jgi:hypothetical protein